jgi:glycosyltransferase involved in cell wall biosynthesis
MLLHDGVRNHVLWLQDATDFELEYSYKIADALLFPSQNEGFGLPLVEAAYQGLQILCSDIPIFRELAGDNAEYFTLTNEDELSKSMMQWDKENNHPDSGNIRLYTWQECTEEILNILNDITDPYIVVGKS